jgi:hypothetical protein
MCVQVNVCVCLHSWPTLGVPDAAADALHAAADMEQKIGGAVQETVGSGCCPVTVPGLCAIVFFLACLWAAYPSVARYMHIWCLTLRPMSPSQQQTCSRSAATRMREGAHATQSLLQVRTYTVHVSYFALPVLPAVVNSMHPIMALPT